jgi:hypothetical protein
VNAQERRSLIADAVLRKREERLEQESAKYEEWLLREATRRRVAAELSVVTTGDDE